MFASHNVVTKNDSPTGFILLQVLRSYLELDAFASLTVQTERTMDFGVKELETFEKLVQVQISFSFDAKWTIFHICSLEVYGGLS